MKSVSLALLSCCVLLVLPLRAAAQYPAGPYPNTAPAARNQSPPLQLATYPPSQPTGLGPRYSPVPQPETAQPWTVAAKHWPHQPAGVVNHYPTGYVPQAHIPQPVPAPNYVSAETPPAGLEFTPVAEDNSGVCWESSFELGLNGSEGNSQAINFRLGFDTKRTSDFTEFTFDLDYKKDNMNNVETVNRLFADARNEWLLGKSPWLIFLHGTVEYDEFKNFDSRLAGDTGFGYQFIKDDINELKGRIGVGASHEFDGPDSSTPIEASLGLSFSRKISDRQKFSASVDYFPEFRDFMNSRITTKADWEILLDEASKLSLKIGLIGRYDSTPNGAKHNDIDYAITLLWKF